MAKNISRDEYFDIRMFLREGGKFTKMEDGTSRYNLGLNDDKIADQLREQIPHIKARDVARARVAEGHVLHKGGKREAANGVTEERLKKVEGRVLRLLQLVNELTRRLDAVEDAMTRTASNGQGTFEQQLHN